MDIVKQHVISLHNRSEECSTNNPGEENNMLLYSTGNLLMIFFSVHAFFMVIRLIAIIYFITQAIIHAKKGKENQDIYTFMTFLLLGISSISLFFGRLIYMIGSFMMIATGDF